MKLTLTFSVSGNHHSITHLELPATASQLLSLNEHVLSLSYLIGKLTVADLTVTCYVADLWNYPIQKDVSLRPTADSLNRYLLMRFERYNGTRMERKHLRIACPIPCPIQYSSPAVKYMSYNRIERFLLRLEHLTDDTKEQQAYIQFVNDLAEKVLTLLNSEPPVRGHSWALAGFHPYWLNRVEAAGVEHPGGVDEDMQEVAEKARELQQLPEPSLVMAEGAEKPRLAQPKRKTGPAPGVFRGVLLRSQTEIRFAAQLEQRGIRWLYEPERLGAEQYLVDFYLPDLGIWVEVKHSMDARDEYQLPPVSGHVQTVRNERLYVHTPREAYRVTPEGFSRISHRYFWEVLYESARE